MKEEWKKVKLGEITESCLGKMLDKNKNKGIPQPYLANLNVRWGSFDLENLSLMKFEEREEERYGLKYGDLIVCEGGEPGRCAIWKNELPNMKIQKALHRVRCKEIIDYRFLFYWFLLAGKKGELEQYYTGATIKHMPGDKLKTITLEIPPLPTQQKIASILSAYDDLIENNRKQISLLEEAAQKLYKEWFVKLNFPGHENTKIVDGIPEGWKKEQISDWCRIFTGKKNANQNVEKGVYPFFTCAPDPLLSNDSLYEGKAVIISGNGSYTGRTQFYDGHFDLYQRTYACVKQKDVSYEYMPFIYYSMKVLFEPIKMGGTKGAAIPYIVMNDITDTVFLYNEEICKKYSSFAEITLDKIGALKRQIQLLQSARDKLLPKLMNGEIEV